MFKTYIKIAWRNILNRKFYTFLNISGLALAISCCIFIYLYSSYNLSFDRYHKYADRTFRLVNQLNFDKTEYSPGTSYAEYQFLKTNSPQVQQAAFLLRDQSFIVNTTGGDPKRFKEDNSVSFADGDWFKIFTYKWLTGSPDQLNDAGNAVLSQKKARQYFGDADPIGKVILFDGHPVKVSGLIADTPYNTDLKSDIYISFKSLFEVSPGYAADKSFKKDWGNLGTRYTGFVVLKNASDQAVVEQQLAAMKKKLFGTDEKIFGFTLLPLKDNHFDTRYLGVIQKSLLWNLAIIGLLIITIAVINYINIVVAQQTRRGVEIGTRKVLGGSVGQIFMQFIVESLVTSVIAVCIAVLLVAALLPMANSWLFTDAPIHVVSTLSLAGYVLLVLLAITIGTGLYPAFLLSRVSIQQALKNNLLNLPAGVGRKVLVVFQNTVTQGLIVCTIIVIMQVYFLKNTDLGFDRNLVITIPTGLTNTSQQYQLRQSLKQMPGVQSVSFCLNSPSTNSQRGATIQYDTHDWEKWPARFALGDSAYARTFGLQIISGRNIRHRQPVPEFLINKTMADMLTTKYKGSVLGKKLLAGDSKGVIVGVVKDFSINSLVGHIEPSIMLEDSLQQRVMAVKLSRSNTATTINNLQKVYRTVLPDQVFSYQFIDEQIARLYQKESIQQKLIWVGAIIAIIISSLGLLGLVSLVALQRTKEIGIRKILGASVTQICLMLSNDFVWMVGLAFVIATPISLWIMHSWLQSYAYHIQIRWWMFASAGVAALAVALISVGFQAVKAAVANPVKSLRSE